MSYPHLKPVTKYISFVIITFPSVPTKECAVQRMRLSSYFTRLHQTRSEDTQNYKRHIYIFKKSNYIYKQILLMILPICISNVFSLYKGIYKVFINKILNK